MLKKSKINNLDVNTRIVEELLSKADPSELFGRDGIFNQLKKQIVERVLESELDHELGYSKHSKILKTDQNRRNGNYEKTIIDNEGYKLNIDIPRDRDGDYNPKLIPKNLFKVFLATKL